MPTNKEINQTCLGDCNTCKHFNCEPKCKCTHVRYINHSTVQCLNCGSIAKISKQHAQPLK